MQEQTTELFEQLLKSYEAYFDIERDTEYDTISVAAEAAFHSRSEKYVLVKKAQLWAAEAHEYVFVITTDHLDKASVEQYRKVFLEEGLKRVVPKKDHMYTYITLVILADKADADALSCAKKMRYHKSYRLSLHGWCDLRVAVCETGTETVVTNGAGRDLKKMFRSVIKKIRRDKR